MKGSNNNVAVDLILKETDNDEWLYTFSGVSTNWEQIAVPLSEVSWIHIDWDGDGGPSTFSMSNIASWKILVEAQGSIVNNEIYLDAFSILTNPLPFDDWSYDSYLNYNTFVANGKDDTPSDWVPATNGGTPGNTFYNVKEITTNGAHSGQCLHYNYNIGDAWESIGYMNNNFTNWAGKNWIALWLKGDKAGVAFDVYFKEPDNDEWVYQTTSISTDWQQVFIPLQASSWQNADWDGDSGPANFDATQISKWGLFVESTAGSVSNYDIYIDDITMLTNPLPVDDWSFDGYVSYDSFLSVGYTDDPSDWVAATNGGTPGNTFYNVKEITTNGAHSGQCLHYNYNIGDAYESVGFVNNNPTNWTGASYLSVWVKGYAGDNEILDIYFKESDNDEWVYQYSGINENWQEVKIPLTSGVWTLTDWDGDGNGDSTLSLNNILRWSIGVENESGGIVGKDVYFDDIKAVVVNTPPKVIAFSPQYQSSTNNPLVQLKVIDDNGIDTNSIQLQLNGTPISYSLVALGSKTNIISYQTSGLTFESRAKVELNISDITSKTQYFSFSFWVGNQELTYDTWEYDKNYLQATWGNPMYHSSGSADIESTISSEGIKSVRLAYNLGPGYGEYGMSKTFDTLQDWSSFSNLFISTRVAAVQANTFLDVLIEEDSGDIWTTQLGAALDQTTWEEQKIDISNGLAPMTFATWCTEQPGYTGDGQRDADKIKKIIFNISGEDLNGSAFFDNFYVHGYAINDVLPPVYKTNSFIPQNKATNVSENTNLFLSVGDNVGVDSNSLYVRLEYVTYTTDYSTNSILVMTNGIMQSSFVGKITNNNSKGYDIYFSPTNALESGSSVYVYSSCKDLSTNHSSVQYSFDVKGVHFENINPEQNAYNVGVDSDIVFFADRIASGSLTVKISNTFTNYKLVTNEIAESGFSLSSAGYGAHTFKYTIAMSNNLFYLSTNYITFSAIDILGNSTVKSFSFVTRDKITFYTPAQDDIKGTNHILFSFSKPYDASLSGITNYKLYFSHNSNLSSVVFSNTFIGANSTNNYNYDPLSTGHWYVQAKAVNKLSQIVGESASVSFFVDLQGPASPVLYSLTNNSFTTDETPSFVWSASSDNMAGVSNYKLEVSQNITFSNVITQNFLTTNGTLSSSLSNGAWWWRVYAIDKVGNKGTVSSANSFTIDKIPPVLSGFSPQNGEVLSDTVVHSFIWSGMDNGVGVKDYDIIVFDNTGTYTDISIQTADYLNVDWPFTQGTTNWWQVIGYDKLGNKTISPVMEFYIDTNSASVKLYEPSIGFTTNLFPNFIWSHTKNGSTNNLLVSANQNFSNILINLKTLSTNTQVNISLVEGTNWWKVLSYNSNTGLWDASAVNYVVVDVDAPISAGLLHPQNNFWTNQTTINFSWNQSIDASSGLSHYILEIATNTSFIGTVFSTNLTTINYTKFSGLTSENYYWRVKSVDNLNNTSISSTNQFGIDWVPPNDSHAVSPISNVVSSTPLFQWVATNDRNVMTPSGVKSYMIYISSSASFSYTNDVYEVLGENTSHYQMSNALSTGQWYWKIMTKDKAGNFQMSNPAINPFTVDGSAPQIVNLNISNNQIVNVPFNFTFDVQDNFIVQSNSLNVIFNNAYIISNGKYAAYGGSIINSTNLLQIVITNLSDVPGASCNLKVSAQDSAGNSVSNTIDFSIQGTFDTIPPILTITNGGGKYYAPVDLIITANEASRIYYTLDGSEPTISSAFVSNRLSLNIAKSKVVKYFAKDQNGNSTSISEQQYEIFDSTKIDKDVYALPNFINVSKNEKAKIIVKKSGVYNIKVYNITGDLVKDYGDVVLPDNGSVEWTGENLPAGVYIVLVKGDGVKEMFKLIQIK